MTQHEIYNLLERFTTAEYTKDFWETTNKRRVEDSIAYEEQEYEQRKLISRKLGNI